jgi:hypothetical protein
MSQKKRRPLKRAPENPEAVRHEQAADKLEVRQPPALQVPDSAKNQPNLLNCVVRGR